MIQVGRFNTLRVVKKLDFGVYVDGGESGEILLPVRYVPPHCEIDDEIEVFIYFDSEDRIIATTEQPLAQVGEFAFLQVKSVNQVGAFLDWGLMKDLLVPFREQKVKMVAGKSYVVYVYVDAESGRIVASAKLDKFVDNVFPEYEPGQEVNLLIETETDLGFTAIINNLHRGMLYKNEVFELLEKGQQLKGYVKKVRTDEKIDLLLHKPGYSKVDDLSQVVIDQLQAHGGFMNVTDKSDPEEIYDLFGMSKKTFKKAIGLLYKNRIVSLENNGIRLLNP
jgi:hypothetical protein